MASMHEGGNNPTEGPGWTNPDGLGMQTNPHAEPTERFLEAVLGPMDKTYINGEGVACIARATINKSDGFMYTNIPVPQAEI